MVAERTDNPPTMMRDAALAYRRDFGWSVIPTHTTTRKPLVKWKKYQEAPPSEKEITDWFTKWPYANIAIVTGAVSNLWVLDGDTPEGCAYLEEIAKTGAPCPIDQTGRGRHYYYTFPGALRNTVKKVDGIDSRGEGGLAHAAPTLHPSGRRYTWERSPWDTPPPPPPAALVNIYTEPMRRETSHGGEAGAGESYARLLAEGSPDGQRHDDMTRLVGHYLAKGIAPAEVSILLRPWVDRCRPPFPYEELDNTIRDIAAAEARKTARMGDDNGANDAQENTDEPATETRSPGVPTFEEALSLPHATLARRYVDAKARLRAADDTLAYIARITQNQAVITPGDDPDAKRRRPVLSHADRVIGVNYALNMRAAGRGLLPKEPVPLWRGQIATASCASPSTVTASTKQLARAGFLDVTPAPGDREAQLFALPATMPGDIPPENLVDFESSRRRKERLRKCRVCGGTRFKQTTVCMECGNIEVEILGQEGDDAAGPVANCNTRVGYGTGGICASGAQTEDEPVASCNRSPKPPNVTALRDRAAKTGHRASREVPERLSPDAGLTDTPERPAPGPAHSFRCHVSPTHTRWWLRPSLVAGRPPDPVCADCHPEPRVAGGRG